MKMKPKKTNLHPKALLYKRFTNVEKSVGTNTVYRYYDGVASTFWSFNEREKEFTSLLKSKDYNILNQISQADNAYFNIDYKPTINTKMVFEFSIGTNISFQRGFLLGCNGVTSQAFYSNLFGVEYLEDKRIRVYFFDTIGDISYSDELETIKIKISVDKQGIEIETNGGNCLNKKFDKSIVNIDMNSISIFGANTTNYGVINFSPTFYFHSLRLYENGVLKANILPAEKVGFSNGVLYDTLRDIEFTNPQGTTNISNAEVIFNSNYENSKIIDIRALDILKYGEMYFQFRITDFGLIDESIVEGRKLTNLYSNNSSKYQINAYYYVGSFDYTQKGSSTETTTQYLKGNIIPLTSMNIVTYNDNLNFKKDDLCVVGKHLFSVEEVEHEHKQMPKDFYIHYLTLNSIL